jgi:hypothetical protein
VGKQGFDVQSKSKEEYNRLNSFEAGDGASLRDALRKRMFTLEKDNRLYYRGFSLSPVENTIFHLMGKHDELLRDVPGMSRGFFGGLLAGGTEPVANITMLKNLLQVMGWGLISVVFRGKSLRIEIRSPPYGMQKGGDNWHFLSGTILGYLGAFMHGPREAGYAHSRRRLVLRYAL